MQRPTSVTVYAALNIVFGALGLLCFQVPLLGAWLGRVPITHPVPIVVAWAASGLLLASGAGMLNVRPWARPVAAAS